MARSHRVGRRAESLAAVQLAEDGWRILARNWRAGPCEIDIVARRDKLVAFVEVRARADAGFGHPLETVGHAKRHALGRAARAWIAAHGRPGDAYRFDVISVVGRAGHRLVAIEHVEGAW
jgi:putative endonuclease